MGSTPIWSGTEAVRYSLGQLQDITGLPPDTLRHWRETLPPLAGRSAHAPCFLPADLLALSVIQLLVRDLGLRVSALTESAEELFGVCRGSNWERLSQGNLVYYPLSNKWSVDVVKGNDINGEPYLSIPMLDIVHNLRARLISESEVSQLSLHLPPVAIQGTRLNKQSQTELGRTKQAHGK